MKHTIERPTYIELNRVNQNFNIDDSKITLFSNLNLKIRQGETYAITGPSGSGKSSLLMLIAGLAKPSSGEIRVIRGEHAAAIQTLKEKIGFIFQQFHLLPEMDVLNNVALPLKLRGDSQAIENSETLSRNGWLNSQIGITDQQIERGRTAKSRHCQSTCL